MCGIVGYVGGRPCQDILLSGLRRLEYRGYDSAGVSLLNDGCVESVRSVGNLDALFDTMERRSRPEGGVATATIADVARTGIGHTRWATHGEVSEENAHPHTGCTDSVQVAVNGIVENFAELRDELEAEGHEFSSETDAEVIAHLVEREIDGGASTAEAVRRAADRVLGHFAFVVMSDADERRLVATRRQCPLLIGLGEGENFIASAIPAFLAETRRVQVLEDGDVAEVTPDAVAIIDAQGKPVERHPEVVEWDADAAEKGGYETFMLKEIHEQPVAVADTLAGRLTEGGRVDLRDAGLDDSELANLDRVLLIGCGTAYHAGLVGRYAIEQWARLPVEMDIASEYRYRNPVIRPGDLLVGISQSGETADTIAAMRLARERGARVLALTNIMGSQATREADATIYTRAGLEVSVAATKTLAAQIAAMYVFALRLAEVRGTLPSEAAAALVEDLRSIPAKIATFLEQSEETVAAVARAYYRKDFFLYLGRHIGLPVCLEGALKLKEISYIPTEAYAAGEMKHGPIALLEKGSPVVCVATDSPVVDKVRSNIAQVKARGAEVIAIATEGDTVVSREANHTIFVPRTDWILQPILAIVPLQLLAYHIARLRGLNVDQPRNLAKTVTVE